MSSKRSRSPVAATIERLEKKMATTVQKLHEEAVALRAENESLRTTMSTLLPAATTKATADFDLSGTLMRIAQQVIALERTNSDLTQKILALEARVCATCQHRCYAGSN